MNHVSICLIIIIQSVSTQVCHEFRLAEDPNTYDYWPDGPYLIMVRHSCAGMLKGFEFHAFDFGECNLIQILSRSSRTLMQLFADSNSLSSTRYFGISRTCCFLVTT